VLVVDDVLATGGTLVGACKLVEKVGGTVAGTTCLIELSFLEGLKKLKQHDFYSVVQY
jgi:adenine phosphoribosyltransferase